MAWKSPGRVAYPFNEARRVANLVIVLATVFVGACTQRVSVSVETFSLPQPLVEKLPLTVGVHYTQDFRSYKRTIDQNVWLYDLSLGPGSVALVDQVLRAVFENVISLPKRELSPGVNSLPAFILEPSVYANVKGGHGLIAGHPEYRVSYRLSFYDIANVRSHVSFASSGRATDLRAAMRHAAARMLSGLPDQEEVRAALERSQNRTDDVDAIDQNGSR